ncbi:MAG: carbohydrate-binding protein, partial [Muribaculaceae bacterium]|nr:carbohydrate-binding protein [Muribaculaceae bacterium]
SLDPYGRVEAETMAWSEGVGTSQNDALRVYVDKVQDGDYIKVSNVDFSDEGAVSFGACVAGKLKGNQIKVFLDSKKGELVAKADVPPTKDTDTWEYFETPTLKEITGVHDVYFVFSGGIKNKALFNFDYWTFKTAESSVEINNANSSHVVVFNLMGVKILETDDKAKISSLPKGIYIINGRKVLI